MKNKKIITITAFITTLIIIAVFLSVKVVNYQSLKNDCLKKGSRPGGYSISLYFQSDTPQSDIDNFVKEAKKTTNIKDIQTISKNEALNDFKKRHKDNPETIKAINELNVNPLSPSIIVKSNISDIDTFLDFEQGILDKLNTHGLEYKSFADGNLKIFQKELIKVNEASLTKDFSEYLFSGEGNHFFEVRYSEICKPNFPIK